MTDILTAERWLFERLSGDATLTGMLGGAEAPRIYTDAAPRLATPTVYPILLLLAPAPGRPVMGVGATIIMFDELWMVKGVTKGNSYAPLGAMMNRADAILHKASGTTTGGVVIGCIAENAVHYDEVDNGVVYKHLGRYYRIYTQ